MKKAEREQVIEKLKAEYHEQDNCMYDFLADTTVMEGMTYEEAMGVYAHLMNYSDNDEFFRINEEDGFKENLVTGEKTCTKRNVIRINGLDMHIEYGHTVDEWEDKYGDDDDLWDILFEEFLTGAVEVREDILYWYIDGRCYETYEDM